MEDYTKDGGKEKEVLEKLDAKQLVEKHYGQIRLAGVLAFFLLSGALYGGHFGFSGEAFSMGQEADAPPAAEDVLPAEALLGKININTADEAELVRLSGIGEKTARAILAYRAEHGAFRQIEEVMDVPGIGEKTFEKIKDDIITG